MAFCRCNICQVLFATPKNLMLHKRSCIDKCKKKMQDDSVRTKIIFLSSQIKVNRIDHEMLKRELHRELHKVMESDT